MRKIIQALKNNILGLLIGFIESGCIGVYAATVIASSSVSYSNTSSGLTSTNVQSAIDELANKADIRKQGNFVAAYTYDQTSGSSTFCVTGEEDTCVKTDCYKTKTANSCKAGDIILYKVNDTTIIPFHVMFDEGSTITMQSQKNTIYNTEWSTESGNSKGPLTILPILESATAGWSNVNDQTYTMGTTVFKTNAYTGCDGYNSCTTNTYTLPERTAKARMITMQEAAILGCTETARDCPIWMYNYLRHSTTYFGGTVNDIGAANGESECDGYWIMSADTSYGTVAWNLTYVASIGRFGISQMRNGARAVVVVSK